MVKPSDSFDEIELLDSAVRTQSAEVLKSGNSHRLKMVVLGLAGLAAVVVFLTSSDPAEVAQDPTPTTAPETVEEATTTTELVPWPSPPLDHNPHVVSLPGNGSPLLETRSGLTLIYVNTRNEPTVVSLDDGTVFKLEVAPGRTYDHFMVESGRIVTSDSSRRNLPLASERALGVNVYRPQAVGELSEPPTAPVEPRPGLSLCLSVSGCPQFEWGTDSLTNGEDTVIRLTSENYPEVAALFDGTTLVLDEHWLVTSNDVLFSARIPTPRDNIIWVLHQPQTTVS